MTQPATEAALQPPKRKLPLWVWIVAGVVALVILLAVTVGIAGTIAAGAGADMAEGAQPVRQADAPSETDVGAEKVAVPDVVGMTVAEGRVAMATAGLDLNAPGAADDAVIATQLYSPGREVDAGTTVMVTVEQVEAGSLESPHPTGYQMTIYEGSPDNELAHLTVAIKDANANAAIAQANQFNDPAQPGYHYVAVEYTFTGASKTEPVNVSSFLWDWSLSQTDGVQIAESNTSVVLPDSWTSPYDVNDLYEGQTGSAVVIYQVPDAYTGPLLATAYGQYVAL